MWAVLGALALCGLGMLSWSDALMAVGKGFDVYLFLTGMMVASELARKEGLFDYLAALAAKRAAVVLTPAVLAVAHVVKAEKPLPYLYICAFIANAASFVLPISNPANLVIFQDRMPTLLSWLSRFAVPSALSIVATYLVLRFTQRRVLTQQIESHVDVPELSTAGKATGYGIVVMAIVMLGASAFNVPLGFPTFCAGLVLFAAVCILKRRFLGAHLAEISWAVLPLVAGLFVLVEGLQRTGVIGDLAGVVRSAATTIPAHAGWISGAVMAVVCNLINNLPAGLIAGSALTAAHAPTPIASTVIVR
ncbi:SLC13 family permease [Paraburkholderia sediminicola]|uniref:SLC13 family permease n=1 Tax=Paraburkholderia sediminicola TaxID=458836 RepID=UPI0038BCB0F7